MTGLFLLKAHAVLFISVSLISMTSLSTELSSANGLMLFLDGF